MWMTFFIILTGDLNGRTANVSQNFVSAVDSDDDVFDVGCKSQSVSEGKQSQDKVVNNY
jgi:hypothetical protein